MDQRHKKSTDARHPLFWHNFLNSKMVTTLMIILLVLIIIFLMTKLAYIFTPVLTLFEIFGFPIVSSAVLYYLFYPIVNQLYNRGIKKSISVFGIFIFLILAISLIIGSIVPIMRDQVNTFIENVPSYYETLMKMFTDLPFSFNDALPELGIDLQKVLDGFSTDGFSQRIDSIVSSTFGGLGSFVGTVTTTFTGLLIIPIFTYYLLVESDKIPKKILYYIPTKYRQVVSRMLYQGNYQVSQYIRGQIIVATCVGIIFAIGYAIIGLEYGTTLAVLAGLLNIIPYLGSFIAIIPALIVGLITSPIMLIKVIIVMVVEQTIEGRFISPQVLGNSMQIHPVTILMVLLASGKLFGVVGVVIGIPTFAVLKVIVSEIYSWYRENNPSYQEPIIDYSTGSTPVINSMMESKNINESTEKTNEK